MRGRRVHVPERLASKIRTERHDWHEGMAMRPGPTPVLAAALAILGTAAAADVSVEQKACAERSRVITRLADRYGETLQSLGLNQSSGVVEIYASDSTGTWTILLTRPDGVTCLLASGQSWEKQSIPPGPKGDDA